MSIQTELTRIINAKAAIKTAVEGKGVAVPDGTLLDGLATLIESIETGGGSGGTYFSTYTLSNPSDQITLLLEFMPNVLVIVGPVEGASAEYVGLAIHIQDADGGVYQEKWRYQSTKYLVGTSATDGSLFTLSVLIDGRFSIRINRNETNYGSAFASREYKIFAAKIL